MNTRARDRTGDWIVWLACGRVFPRMAKRLRCYLGFHRWQRLQAEGGGLYKKCRDCGKFSDIPDFQLPPSG